MSQGRAQAVTVRILPQIAPRFLFPEVSRQVLHGPGMPAEVVIFPALPGWPIPLRFPLFPPGEAVGPGYLWVQAKPGRILSQTAPGFCVLRAPGRSLRAKGVTLPLFSGVLALLETGFQFGCRWKPDGSFMATRFLRPEASREAPLVLGI